MNATTGQDFEEGPALRRRVWIQDLRPRVDGGLFDAKAVVGERITVTCDLAADGHDRLTGELRYRFNAGEWQRLPLTSPFVGRWEASFDAATLGRCEFLVEAWVDRYGTWRAQTEAFVKADQDIAVELLTGAALLRDAAGRAEDAAGRLLREAADRLADGRQPTLDRWRSLTAATDAAAQLNADRSAGSTSTTLGIQIEPSLARFGAWYELFPRALGKDGTHGTLRDVEARLPAIADMGFDVLYVPPIHPVGKSFRKGKDNATTAGPDDPGSPWAIGSKEGGHTAIHPGLGTLEDFRHLLDAARAQGITLALDIAFQASADHPWIQEHPTWFRHRPDGSIQYAENPPKKYQDIYPFDFESADWRELWNALLGIFLYWAEQGVRVFRVDNPHTKPLPFWRWCLAQVKQRYPDAIFLAEAFTRPGVTQALAKLGFSQSYTYFTWRQTKDELTAYLRELTTAPTVDFFRPSFWPNTPDILPEHLQYGTRATFIARLVLAGTLSSNYGIYGPVFELMERGARPPAPGGAVSEEYANSEKYELRHYDVDDPNSLRDVIARLNRVRRSHPALQQTRDLTFHPCDNPQLIVYSKRSGDDVVLIAVNLDPRAAQSGKVSLNLAALGLGASLDSFLVHDELSDRREQWSGAEQILSIDPNVLPATLLHVRRRIRSERDFDYYA